MEKEKKFKTKTGYCHITAQKIILTKDGNTTNVSKQGVGNKVLKSMAIYGALSLFFLYSAYTDYQKGDKLFALIFTILAFSILFGILKSVNNSANPVIERNTITEASFIKGTTGLTRSRFVIAFNENGKVKKRIIMLPGSFNNGQEETELALNIMKEEKIIA